MPGLSMGVVTLTSSDLDMAQIKVMSMLEVGNDGR